MVAGIALKELYDSGHLKAAEEFKKQSENQNEAYKDWQQRVFKQNALDEKTVELVALSAAVALQCEYCIDTHSQKAKAHGATAAEIAGAIQVAAAVRAGSAMSYGVEALREK